MSSIEARTWVGTQIPRQPLFIIIIIIIYTWNFIDNY